MRRSSLARRGGATDEQGEARNRDCGERGEVWVAQTAGGRRVGHFAGRAGDVLLPTGELVEVKSICNPRGQYVIAGDGRPKGRTIVAVQDPYWHSIGALLPGDWEWGEPALGRLVREHKVEACWFAPRSACRWPPDLLALFPVPEHEPVGPLRLCPSCRLVHPPGTTCAGGWGPWAAAFMDEEL